MSYANLGVTCDTSKRVLLSNTKFIPMSSHVYSDCVKLSTPLKVIKPDGKIDNLVKPKSEKISEKEVV
jgi:hypothetical protein